MTKTPETAVPNAQNNQALSKDALVPGKWYRESQVALGKQVYNKSCVGCHLTEGKGNPNWKTPLPSGQFLPPPLNGEGHTWHHPRSFAINQVKYGTIDKGGAMPAHSKILNDKEIIAVVAYVNSLWPDNIYNRWKGGGID